MTQSDIQILHNLYCQLSGFDLNPGYDRERAWQLYIKGGFTADDLRTVLIHIKYGVSKGVRFKAAMGFTRLIWGLDIFEEELALARAHARNNRPRTNREAAIQAFRPQAAETALGPKAKPAKDVLIRLTEELQRALQ